MRRPALALAATCATALVAGFLVVGRSPSPPGAVVVRTTVPVTTTSAPESSSTPSTSTTSTTVPVVDRGSVAVVVANAADVRGIAAATVDRLRVYGYSAVTAVDATDVAPFTLVYFAPGFESAAERLALDLALPATAVAPIEQVPALEDDAPAQLVLVVGTDSL